MTPLEKRIRWSGLLVGSGITVLLLSLFWKHPLSFLAFLTLGCPLALSGILLFLYSLAARDASR